MPFTKGNKGKPKGAKNKVQKNLVQQILEISERLSKEGKGLEDCARQDPGWFHTNFLKGLIPKNVTITGDDGGPVRTSVEVRFIGTNPKNNG